MIDPRQFRLLCIRPALAPIGLWSLAAERLLLATALAESGLRDLVQSGGGPARGLYQMEPATHDDIWNNYLHFRDRLQADARALCAGAPGIGQMVWNLQYASLMARLVYWRRPEPLPPADDIEGHAAYWLAHYNTIEGKGTRAHFLAEVAPHWHTPAFRAPE